MIKVRGEIEALRKEIAGLKTDLDRKNAGAEMQTGEVWRLRGNEAYEAGDMVKAEEYYTKGVNCLPRRDPLLLCYTKRADARMHQGKIRDALWDCELAAEIEPSCLELHITAAKCHLLLGEVAAAKGCFRKCMESGDSVCLDRQVILEAADGLKEVQRVEEYRNDCEELVQQRTLESTANALSLIDDALSISPFSEKLLELKGKALLMLHKYEKVIQLCEKTLDLAEKNFPVVCAQATEGGSWCKLWRWNLMSKAYFNLGKIERALELIKEQDKLSCGKKVQDSSPLSAITLGEILKHKNAGDKANNAGRYTEAVENYSAALLRSTGSRHVAAMCFYNRAVAHLKLDHFAETIADCNLAIALRENYCEAIFVRVTAFLLRARGYGRAADDVARFISALEMQPAGNFDTTDNCKEELQSVHKYLLSAEKMARGGTSLDLYCILGTNKSDTAAAIRKAFREAALRHHPDKVVGKFVTESGDDGKLRDEIGDEIRRNADILFKMIAEAFDILSDPTKACEAWRIRGNEAYEEGDMVKANKYYTLGVNCVSPSQTLGTTTGDSSGRFDALVFCYGKRADLRFSQGDMRGAISDCVVGTELDPSCLNLYITAGNSHLLLGEVEAALEYFSKCTGSGDQVYLDRRIIVASSEGLQKAQRVEEYTTRCNELMQHKTSTSTANALSMIDDALSISSFSEKLLQVKGKALFRLQKYGRVIQLCKQTLDLAEMNFPMVTVPSAADGSAC